MDRKYNIGFIGNFNVPYTTENERRWSFEKLGHTVIPFQENETTAQELESRVFGLDMLIYSHTHGWEIPGLKEVFEEYKKYDVPTVSVHLDRWAWLDRVNDVGKEATWFTQYQFMADGSPEAVELYEKLNLNWHFLKAGVVERDCYIAKPDREKFPHDIVFTGSKGYHPEYPFRKELIDFLANTYGDRFGHYGNDGIRVVRGDELNTLYASAKVVVGDSCFGGRPKYVSDRFYEVRGRGGFLLHPKVEGVDDVGVADYLNGDLADLKHEIDYWIANEDKREVYRQAGFLHVKNNETYTQRSQEMLDVIFKK